jgi:hypothetical protein
MTTQELIHTLSALPGSLEVQVWSDAWDDYLPLAEVFVEEGYLRLTDAEPHPPTTEDPPDA